MAAGRSRPLREVLLEAGAVRFKPILLTALAAMIGAATILLDPIFQGLAISLLFGRVVDAADRARHSRHLCRVRALPNVPGHNHANIKRKRWKRTTPGYATRYPPT